MPSRKQSAIATIATLKARAKLAHVWFIQLDVLLWRYGDLLTEDEWRWIASVKQPNREDIYWLRQLQAEGVERHSRRYRTDPEAHREAHMTAGQKVTLAMIKRLGIVTRADITDED